MKKFLLFLVVLVILGGTFSFLYMQNKKYDIPTDNVFKETKDSNQSLAENDYQTNDITEKIADNSTNTKIDVIYVSDQCSVTNNNGEVIFKNQRNIPYIIFDNKNVQDKINKELTDSSANEWYGDIISASFFYLDNTVFSDDLGATLLFGNDNIVKNVFTIDRELLGNFGGVSWIDTYMYNFNLENGELLSFEDVFVSDDNTMDYLMNAIIKYYKDEYQVDPESEYGVFFDDWRETFPKEVILDGNWKLTDDGVEFVLTKYSIAPGATGTPSFKLNKDEANKILKDEYKF